MITLEQVKQLELKVTRLIDHVKKVTAENTALKGKLDSYQKRIDELEVMFQRFKDEQSQIADGFLAVLERLNQVEDAAENALPSGSALPSENALSSEGSLPPIQSKSRQATLKPEVQKPEIQKKEENGSEPVLSTSPQGEVSRVGGELDIF